MKFRDARPDEPEHSTGLHEFLTDADVERVEDDAWWRRLVLSCRRYDRKNPHRQHGPHTCTEDSPDDCTLTRSASSTMIKRAPFTGPFSGAS